MALQVGDCECWEPADGKSLMLPGQHILCQVDFLVNHRKAHLWELTGSHLHRDQAIVGLEMGVGSRWPKKAAKLQSLPGQPTGAPWYRQRLWLPTLGRYIGRTRAPGSCWSFGGSPYLDTPGIHPSSRTKEGCRILPALGFGPPCSHPRPLPSPALEGKRTAGSPPWEASKHAGAGHFLGPGCQGRGQRPHCLAASWSLKEGRGQVMGTAKLAP